MKYRRKPFTVEAHYFDGTEEGVIEVQDWLSSLDIENVEVSAQGDEEPLALDVTAQGWIRTCEAGSWLTARRGVVGVESGEDFGANYEPAE